MKSIPNVVCRSRIFHFRRAVPVDLRSTLRRTELTCTLHTGDAATAKLLSKLLYVTSERLFEQVRHSPMLSEEQLSALVKDFYATVISQENALRLGVSRPINEEARLARVAYYKSVAEQTKLSLARNQFADAAFVSDAMLRKHKLAGTLKPAEIVQVRQAMLRAGIDLAEHMTARYEGDFNHEPRDNLLRAQLVDIAARPTAQPQAAQAPTPTGPLFSTLSQPFVDAQIATKAWERQTAAQAEKTFRLFVEINGDLPIDQYAREHAARFKDFIQRLPADYGKAAAYRNMPINEIIAKHAAAPAEDKHIRDLEDSFTQARHHRLNQRQHRERAHDHVPVAARLSLTSKGTGPLTNDLLGGHVMLRGRRRSETRAQGRISTRSRKERHASAKSCAK